MLVTMKFAVVGSPVPSTCLLYTSSAEPPAGDGEGKRHRRVWQQYGKALSDAKPGSPQLLLAVGDKRFKTPPTPPPPLPPDAVRFFFSLPGRPYSIIKPVFIELPYHPHATPLRFIKEALIVCTIRYHCRPR